MPEELQVPTSELLAQRLELVLRWYAGMVNPSSGMLEYLYIPEDDTLIRQKSPIRDIGSVWDAEILGDFLGRGGLRPLIERSLRHYGDYLVERDGCLILDPHRLEEPSSIAHSAFMILALLRAGPARDARQVELLAAGILGQQRKDGSYKVHFDDLPDHGEELYAGEAMLALIETYGELRDERYLQSVERGYRFYDTQYFRRGRVSQDTLVFFANWQSQACRRLFELTGSAPLRQEVAAYLYRMHDEIIERGFYAALERHPQRHVSVEAACALEGLNDAFAVALASNDERAERYRRCICAGLAYLLRLQCVGRGLERERGGFGMSLENRAQRIDVTGHAASAFIKCVENRVDCQALGSIGANGA